MYSNVKEAALTFSPRGGFLSDLTFFGGAVGFQAGSQQFTARNLHFDLCLTAIRHVWNWSFTWTNVSVNAVYTAFDLTLFKGDAGQGTGSVSIIGKFHLSSAFFPQPP